MVIFMASCSTYTWRPPQTSRSSFFGAISRAWRIYPMHLACSSSPGVGCGCLSPGCLCVWQRHFVSWLQWETDREGERERKREITISKQLELCQRHSKKQFAEAERGCCKKWAGQQHSTPHFCCVVAVACGMNAPVVVAAVVVAAAHRKQKLKSENYKTFYLASLLLHLVVVVVAAVSFMQSWTS